MANKNLKEELSKALHKIKKNKGDGDDQIVIEMWKAGGITIIKSLARLYNMCPSQGITPTNWDKAIIIKHKKGDTTHLNNYRPSSLLSDLYKLFMKIIFNSLRTRLYFYQL